MALNEPQNTLPQFATPFIGRKGEIKDIAALLANPACKLLTLVGPGGIGKTRLAVESASHAMIELNQGVYFVSLTSLSTADGLVPAIANPLGLQFYGGQEPKQQLLDFLANQQLLLVLDNFEQLVDGGAELLSEILQATSSVRLLVTSRERLNLIEEWVLEVGGLSFPTSDAESAIEDYSAVQLFVLGARRAHIGFKLTERQKPSVVRICQVVGGMPLGIELAAAWVYTLSCETILEQIQRGLDILATSARNMAARHRSMRAAFLPTWQRLSDDEQTVFKKLSVFRGGFTYEAAQAIAGATPQVLSTLASRSLLQMDGNGRYAMHELLRQFGEEQLNTSFEGREQARSMHCAFYANVGDLEEGNWFRQSRRIAWQEIEQELANILVAFDHALDEMRLKEIERLLGVIEGCSVRRNRYVEGNAVLGRAAQQLRDRLDLAVEAPRLLALCLAGQAWCLYLLARRTEAEKLLYEGLELLRALPPGEEILIILQRLGIVPSDFAERKRAILEGLPIARALGNKGSQALFLDWLSEIALQCRELAEARRYAAEALSLSREIGEYEIELYGLVALGNVALCEEKYGETKWYIQQYHIQRGPGSDWWANFSLGDVAYCEGIYPDAKAYYQASMADMENLNVPTEPIVWGLGALGRIATKEGDYETARQHLFKGLSVAKALSFLATGLYMVEAVAEFLLAFNQPERATELNTLVLSHPSTEWRTMHWASRLMTELAPKLAPEVFLEARIRGKTLDLNSEVTALLVFLNQPLKASASPVPIATGHPRDLLGKRELEILRLISAGLSNKEVAAELFLAPSTVKWYVNEILSKLGVSNRTQAGIRARELGILT